MNIIVAGAGKVGTSLAWQLSAEGHDLTLIDLNPATLEELGSSLDVMCVQGNCAALPTLRQAGVMDADLLIAATNSDELNLLCCTTAHGINPAIHTIGRIRNPEYTQQIYDLKDVFALSLSVNPERQAASEIEQLLRLPGFLHRDTFAKGRTNIVELRVSADSKLCDQPLYTMSGLVKCQVLVCAVIREKQAIIPSGNFVLRDGDRIFVTAPTANLSTLLRNLGLLARRARRVILCGGGRVSYYLSQQLCRAGVSVTLIERDEQRCAQLAGLLPEVSIIAGDATDQALLESQGIDDCDALVTLTGVDELNMIISLYGIGKNVPQVITKLGRAANRSIAETLELGSVVYPRELCSNQIVRYVRAMQNQSGAAVSVHFIADGQVEAIEFHVDGQTRNCGRPLKELKLRPEVLLVSINSGDTTTIPNGDSRFHEGDTVVVVTSRRGQLRQINDIFA